MAHPRRRRRWLLAVVPLAAAVLVAACGGSSAPPRRAGTATPPPAGSSVRGAVPSAPVNVYAQTMAGDMSPAVAGDLSLVYVPNSMSNTVDVIDPKTLAVVSQFAVGALPQHVVPSWDLRTLYVNNNDGNSLTPIDPRTGRPGTPIPVSDPYNLYFSPDGSKAIVMAERNSEIDFRDPHTFQLVKALHVPYRGVNHADFTADGKTMIVSCEFSGYVIRVDLTTMTVTGVLKVGGAPQDVRSSPDGSVFYVANLTRDGVSVIDPVAMREVQFIHTAPDAHGLYPSRDGTKLYVSNRRSGTISVIDFATRTVVATWHVGGSPDMGGVSADGTRLWMSNRYNGSVSVIDTTTGQVIKVIKVGSGPHGVCVFPQPGRFSLGHTGNYR